MAGGKKVERGTSKYLAIRMKSKGLQKLKFYCQVCEKQCRDENGFKCHILSESHNRQIQIVADNPEYYIDKFSEEFRKSFVDLMRMSYPNKTVSANIIYKDFISDRSHVHMNSTKWTTLTDFCKFLESEGSITIEDIDERNGLMVKYVNKSVTQTDKQLSSKKSSTTEVTLQSRELQKQIEFANSQLEKSKSQLDGKNEDEILFDFKPLHRDDNGTINLKLTNVEKNIEQSSTLYRYDAKDNILNNIKQSCKINEKNPPEHPRKVLDQSLSLQREEKWINPNLIVKIITEDLGEDYLEKKCLIRRVDHKDKSIAYCDTIFDNEPVIIRIHEDELQTVLPAIGKPVQIVVGKFKGMQAKILKLNVKTFDCIIQITQGPLRSKIVENIPYEHICKLAI
ncbi:MAG: hypothetical protein MHMPM18_002699 [Marteilia pararefringens]